MLRIQKFTFNPIQENMYVLYDETKECVIIDPGCYFDNEEKKLQNFIEENKLVPKYLLNTHCHLDHICGNAFVSKTWHLSLSANPLDAYNLDLSIKAGISYNMPIAPSPPISLELQEGDTIQFGNISLDVLFTPGHCSGHIAFYNEAHKVLISGDCLFRESIGRTDLPGGDWDTLIESIQTKLFTLPEDTTVYSGHGQETTIGYEMRNNPFFK
jgi:hydroxyacylglutathione hydrolase